MENQKLKTIVEKLVDISKKQEELFNESCRIWKEEIEEVIQSCVTSKELDDVLNYLYKIDDKKQIMPLPGNIECYTFKAWLDFNYKNPK